VFTDLSLSPVSIGSVALNVSAGPSADLVLSVGAFTPGVGGSWMTGRPGPSLSLVVFLPSFPGAGGTGRSSVGTSGRSVVLVGFGFTGSGALATAGSSGWALARPGVKYLYPYPPPPRTSPEPPRMSASLRWCQTLAHSPPAFGGVGTPATAASTSAGLPASTFISTGLPPMPASLRHAASRSGPAGCPAPRPRSPSPASSSPAPRPSGPGRP